MDPTKLRADELRSELSERGLDTSGIKAVLVERLREALEKETGQASNDSSIGDNKYDSDGEGDEEESTDDDDLNLFLFFWKLDKLKVSELKRELRKRGLDTTGVKAILVDRLKKALKTAYYAGTNNNDGEGGGEASTSHVEPVPAQDLRPQRKRAFVSSPPERETLPVTVQEPKIMQDNDETRAKKFPPRKPDNEPDYDENAELLSWYDSDLNLIIERTSFLSASPMHKQGFAYIWAGVRATFGLKTGKVAFEVKVVEDLDVSLIEEKNPNVLRVGWSVVNSSLQLGEEPLSYGYEGTGKSSIDCNFKEYGKPYVVGDVVGAFIDMDSDPISLSFTVNGEDQGVMYNINRADLDGNALFPHILSKNVKFEVNFGTQDVWFPMKEGYIFASEVPIEKRVAGPKRLETRQDCEMIMMCGLRSCGKTVWANELRLKHPEKKYNVLSTKSLIDKMKVDGLPRKTIHEGRWDMLLDKCVGCLIKLVNMAAVRRRNYILDLTDIHPSVQRRKMRGFEDFTRRAIVIVPTDEEFKSRIAKREAVEGKYVPETAVLEMKANFMLPEEGDFFNEVRYVELEKKEAQAIVEQYNEEGRSAGYGKQQKRPRTDNHDKRDRGYQPREGNCSSWQPRGGGWSDCNPSSGGSNGNFSGYNANVGGGSWWAQGYPQQQGWQQGGCQQQGWMGFGRHGNGQQGYGQQGYGNWNQAEYGVYNQAAFGNHNGNDIQNWGQGQGTGSWQDNYGHMS